MLWLFSLFVIEMLEILHSSELFQSKQTSVTRKTHISAAHKHNVTILNRYFIDHVSRFSKLTYIATLHPTHELHCYQLSPQYISHSMLTWLALNHIGLQHEEQNCGIECILHYFRIMFRSRWRKIYFLVNY